MNVDLKRDTMTPGHGVTLFVGLIGSIFLFVVPAFAERQSECRAALRPLLLQPDPDEAELRSVRELCEREAEAGNPEATYQLSFFYLGLDSWDPATATSLILDAAGQNIPEAQYWLAWQYDSGPLLPNDAELALQWYEASAARDHPLALQRLAEAYAAGELGLPVDKKRASELRAEALRCAEQSG
jgi:TPR repeat protein